MKFINTKGNYVIKPPDKEIKKRKSAYGVCIKDDKILVVKPTWVDLWELPGGGIETMEEILDGLKREFLEETGFKIVEFDPTPIKSIKQNFYADSHDEYYDSEMIFFLIKKLGKIQDKTKINRKEIKDVQWINYSDLNNSNCKITYLTVIKEIYRRYQDLSLA